MTISPGMIVLAREAEGLTQSSVAHSVGISQALLSRIENGFDEPSEEVIMQLASTLNVPTRFFTQTEAILGEGVVDFFHRKRLTLPAKPLKRAHARVNMMRLEIVRLLNAVELADTAPFPEYLAEDYGSSAEIAQLVRATWRVPDGPLPNLVALIEATGTPIVLADLGHEKLSAISMPGFAGRHVIVLNSQMPASHQRYALAHETGHLVMHRGVASEDLERDADLFAAELLMPAAVIRPQLRNIRFGGLGALKPIWHTSLAALIRTAYNLGEITERQYRYFNMQLNQLPGGRKREPGEFLAEEPRLIRSMIDHLRNDLGYSTEDVAKLMGATEARIRSQYLGEAPAPLRSVGRTAATVFHLPPRAEA